MKIRAKLIQTIALSLACLMMFPPGLFAQTEGGATPLRQEELDQVLAPIALYPDSLLAQIFMASTYPLEVVEADRWTKQNAGLKGDALTTALEGKNWDPSVKSLVNFPDVLAMMSQELEWTQKLGDAFLAQQQDVMNTVQSLRQKAQAQGNLETTEQQKVIVQKETQTIVIESASPQVVYVPAYNPTVVYGSWWYPSYPPYAYYPPGYAAGAALFSFGVGVAVGAAWGYAWGGCNWRGGNVDVDINRNTNINRNINRDRYSRDIARGGGGRGEWNHNPSHRKGVAYRDQNTANKFNRGESKNAKSREAFRGRAETGRQDLARDSGARARDSVQRDGGAQTRDRAQRDAKSADRQNLQQKQRPQQRDTARAQQGSRQQSVKQSAGRSADRSAFGGYD
ncbi:DUF3300 domain-containing protein, partial [Desulfococcus sp.]|uniref:DUF3300 domain-containing protein n=1 Tax=Desulfococcus sp. TaxID=2025834 RepID=UPI0035946B32